MGTVGSMSVRLAALLLLLAASTSVPVTTSEETATGNAAVLWESPQITARGASPDQLARLELALARFAAAGLDLPALEVEFVDHPDRCGEYLGRFDSSQRPWTIVMCFPAGFLYEHELAHAWERAHLTDEVRQAFMDLLGFTNWADPEAGWDERGMEGAAFVIQQGLGGLPLPPHPREETVGRLSAFELLTGRPSPLLVEWLTQREVPCDDRPTPRSLALPDARGEKCSP